jgi:hypothetical protein
MTAEIRPDRAARFRGRNSAGTPVTGATPLADIDEWVRSKYTAGWRELTVVCGEEQVGGIGLSSDARKRTWWAITAVQIREDS